MYVCVSKTNARAGTTYNCKKLPTIKYTHVLNLPNDMYTYNIIYIMCRCSSYVDRLP